MNTIHKTDYEQFENGRWERKNQKLIFRHTATIGLLSKLNSESVLDVGCGDGLLQEHIAERLLKVATTGIDLSEVAVEKAKEKHIPNATFMAADVIAAGIPYPPNTFDVVIALDVLEHLFVPETLLREMKRASKRHLIIGVPNFSSFPARVQTLIGKVPENNHPKKGHAYWFNYHILSKMLDDNGLTIITVRFNCQLERLPLFGTLIRRLALAFPNLFALSFVILAEKRESKGSLEK